MGNKVIQSSRKSAENSDASLTLRMLLCLKKITGSTKSLTWSLDMYKLITLGMIKRTLMPYGATPFSLTLTFIQNHSGRGGGGGGPE